MRELFLKYQKELVKLANLDSGRRFLGIDHEAKNEWIAGITPNSYHIKVGRNKYKGVFRGYDLFAKRIGYSLLQNDIFRFEKERNPDLYKGLNKYKSLLYYTELAKGAFPQILLASGDPIYAGAGDGTVWAVSTVWDTCHDAASGAGSDDTTADAGGARTKFVSPNYQIFRSFFPFDTSGIGASMKVDSCIGSIYPTIVADNDNDGYDFVVFVGASQASATALVNDDFDQCGDINNPTEWSDRLDLTGISANQYHTFTFTAAGISGINVSGYTKCGFREGHDTLDHAIAADYTGFQQIAYSETTGTTSDPKLVVTYTLLSGSAAFFMNLI